MQICPNQVSTKRIYRFSSENHCIKLQNSLNQQKCILKKKQTHNFALTSSVYPPPPPDFSFPPHPKKKRNQESSMDTSSWHHSSWHWLWMYQRCRMNHLMVHWVHHHGIPMGPHRWSHRLWRCKTSSDFPEMGLFQSVFLGWKCWKKDLLKSKGAYPKLWEVLDWANIKTKEPKKKSHSNGGLRRPLHFTFEKIYMNIHIIHGHLSSQKPIWFGCFRFGDSLMKPKKIELPTSSNLKEAKLGKCVFPFFVRKLPNILAATLCLFRIA